MDIPLVFAEITVRHSGVVLKDSTAPSYDEFTGPAEIRFVEQVYCGLHKCVEACELLQKRVGAFFTFTGFWTIPCRPS